MARWRGLERERGPGVRRSRAVSERSALASVRAEHDADVWELAVRVGDVRDLLVPAAERERLWRARAAR